MSSYESRFEKPTTTTTTTTTFSSLPVPGDAISMAAGKPVYADGDATSMAAGEPVYAPPKPTKEQQELKNLADRLLDLKENPKIEPKTKEVVSGIAMKILALINSGEDPKSNKDLQTAKKTAIGLLTPKTPEEKGLIDLAKKLSESATPEQLDIAFHVFEYVVGTESIGGVYYACDEYFTPPRKMPGFFSMDEVGKIIKQIYELSQTMYKKELSSSSSASNDGSSILSFDDEESVLLSPANPQGVIDFYNMPGKDHYLFVRLLEDPIKEADILLGKIKIGETTETHGKKHTIMHWRSATAIKHGVPIHTCLLRYVGFLLAPNASVGTVSIPQKTGSPVERTAWGKRDLYCWDGYSGLDKEGPIHVTQSKEKDIEKNPDIGSKLQEIQDRIYGRWSDLSTKELYAFLYDLHKIMKLPKEQRDKEIRTLFSQIRGSDSIKLPSAPIEDTETAIRILAPEISPDDLSKLASLMSETDIAKGIKVLAPNITDHDLKDFVDLRKKLDKGASFKRKDPTENLSPFQKIMAQNRLPRYRHKDGLDNNEVLIHPTLDDVLGIVCVTLPFTDIKSAINVQTHIRENGGPDLPIYLYNQKNGELKKFTDEEIQQELLKWR